MPSMPEARQCYPACQESIFGAVKFLDTNQRLQYLTNKLINQSVFYDLAGPPQPYLIGPADPACNPSRLARGEAMASELAEPFEMSFPAVSEHLKVRERRAGGARTQRAVPSAPAQTGADASKPLPSLEQRFERLDVSERSSAWRRK